MEGPASSTEGNGSVLAPPSPSEDTASAQPLETSAPAQPADKKKMRRGPKIAMWVIIVVTLLEAAAFGGTYYFYTRHYVSTDNAQVDGDKIDINAPITGTLQNWSVDQGTQVRDNQVLGRVRVLGSGGQPERVVKAPGTGVVAVNNAVNGQFVSAGTELATAYDFSKVYVTARVEENDISDVQVGQLVDISVDAFPGAQITGLVEDVQNSAASEFTIYPSPSTDPTNPQKVDQYVPVKIELLQTDGHRVVPGMNVTVHIHKD